MTSPTERATTTERSLDGIIDPRVFQGVLNLNDSDSTDFSTQLFDTYLAVAKSTLNDMDRAVGNKDFSELSLLAASLQDTSDAMGVVQVRQSCSRLQEVIRAWAETKLGPIDGITTAHERLKTDFAVAKTQLTKFVETGVVPSGWVAPPLVVPTNSTAGIDSGRAGGLPSTSFEIIVSFTVSFGGWSVRSLITRSAERPFIFRPMSNCHHQTVELIAPDLTKPHSHAHIQVIDPSTITRLVPTCPSFVSTARALRTTCSVRQFSTPTPGPTKPSSSSSNLPLYLGGAGVVGLATYVYLGGSAAPFSTTFRSTRCESRDPEKSALDPERFLDLKLKAVEPYNHNTSRFVFELPDGGAALSPVTSLVVVRASEGADGAPLDKKGNPVIRPYTPISRPEHEGELVLLIKKYESGVISKYVHERLKPGATLAIKGPILKFPYKANEFEQVALIGGGSGITPLYQLLDHALADPANRTRFTLLFANVSEADILLREELSALERAHPQALRIVHTLDKPPQGWAGASGYVSRDLIKTHVPPAELGDKVKVFVCGPPGQVTAVAGKKDGMKQGAIGGILKELGYSEDQVFKF
ncbi:hypothetical protein BJY52DRAFT_1186290 [Lactarius psammicola]|nr:hypothetical protein BJY52DRAFT_1186290 [Lactarius psammicola]